MKPKRFLVFQYDDYYPRGGMEDFTGSFDTLEEALAAPTKGSGADSLSVFDIETGDITERRSFDGRWYEYAEWETLHRAENDKRHAERMALLATMSPERRAFMSMTTSNFMAPVGASSAWGRPPAQELAADD